MTALIAAAVKFGPWLLGLVGVLFGWLRHKQAQTTEAQAGQKVAEADARVAQSDAVQAKANEDAALAGADAAKERTHVENEIAAGQPGESARILRDQWSRD